MLTATPDHDWMEYDLLDASKVFPGRKAARLCRACGVAERLDGSHPPCIDFSARPTPPVFRKELRN